MPSVDPDNNRSRPVFRFDRALVCGAALLVFLSSPTSVSSQISPAGGGTYDVGTQLSIHVEWCSASGFFDAWGYVYLNGYSSSTSPGLWSRLFGFSVR